MYCASYAFERSPRSASTDSSFESAVCQIDKVLPLLILKVVVVNKDGDGRKLGGNELTTSPTRNVREVSPWYPSR